MLPACTPKLLLGLFPLRGASAPKLRPAGFGDPYIFWLWHSPGQGPAAGRHSSWEVWGSPSPPPPFSPFQLFELSSSCSQAAPAPGKTLCVPSCTFPHLPQTLPSHSTGQHRPWARRRRGPGASSIETARASWGRIRPPGRQHFEPRPRGEAFLLIPPNFPTLAAALQRGPGPVRGAFRTEGSRQLLFIESSSAGRTLH